MKSLRLRLLLGAVLGASVALALAGVVLVALFDAHVHRRYVKELDDHLLQLATAVQVDQAGTIALKHDLSDPAFQRPLSADQSLARRSEQIQMSVRPARCRLM